MPSERPNPRRVTRRRAASGFTLLEVLLAFAMLTTVTGATLQVTSATLRDNAIRLERAWLAELARSVAEEHLVTRPAAGLQGSLLGSVSDWHWRIEERPARAEPGLPPEALGRIVEVTVSAWKASAPERMVTLESLVADGAPR